jgi:hypothetical protein
MAVTGIGIPESSIRFGDCELNASSFELRRGRRIVKLERIPLQVLRMLIEQHGKVVTREAIADHVWAKAFLWMWTMESTPLSAKFGTSSTMIPKSLDSWKQSPGSTDSLRHWSRLMRQFGRSKHRMRLHRRWI